MVARELWNVHGLAPLLEAHVVQVGRCATGHAARSPCPSEISAKTAWERASWHRRRQKKIGSGGGCKFTVAEAADSLDS